MYEKEFCISLLIDSFTEKKERNHNILFSLSILHNVYVWSLVTNGGGGSRGR